LGCLFKIGEGDSHEKRFILQQGGKRLTSDPSFIRGWCFKK
jgi:hypothetical protein